MRAGDRVIYENPRLFLAEGIFGIHSLGEGVHQLWAILSVAAARRSSASYSSALYFFIGSPVRGMTRRESQEIASRLVMVPGREWRLKFLT